MAVLFKPPPPGRTSICDGKVVHKMTEKFARNGAMPAELDVAKRTYYLAEGHIRALYHYPDSDVTRVCKVPRHVPTYIYAFGQKRVFCTRRRVETK